MLNNLINFCVALLHGTTANVFTSKINKTLKTNGKFLIKFGFDSKHKKLMFDIDYRLIKI